MMLLFIPPYLQCNVLYCFRFNSLFRIIFVLNVCQFLTRLSYLSIVPPDLPQWYKSWKWNLLRPVFSTVNILYFSYFEQIWSRAQIWYIIYKNNSGITSSIKLHLKYNCSLIIMESIKIYIALIVQLSSKRFDTHYYLD